MFYFYFFIFLFFIFVLYVNLDIFVQLTLANYLIMYKLSDTGQVNVNLSKPVQWYIKWQRGTGIETIQKYVQQKVAGTEKKN